MPSVNRYDLLEKIPTDLLPAVATITRKLAEIRGLSIDPDYDFSTFEDHECTKLYVNVAFVIVSFQDFCEEELDFDLFSEIYFHNQR